MKKKKQFSVMKEEVTYTSKYEVSGQGLEPNFKLFLALLIALVFVGLILGMVAYTISQLFHF